MENEETDITIRQRLKIVKIKEDQEDALSELDDIYKKIEKATEKFQRIKKSEEACLEEIEKEAEERVKMSMLKIDKAVKSMSEMGEIVSTTLTEIRAKSKQVQDLFIGLLGRVSELVGKSDNLMENSEGVMRSMMKAKEELDEKIKANSEFEKVLFKREEEVDIKSKKADEKLKEAKDLAFWHKEPGSKYQQK